MGQQCAIKNWANEMQRHMLQYRSDLRPHLTQRSPGVVVYNGGSDRARVASTTATMINAVH